MLNYFSAIEENTNSGSIFVVRGDKSLYGTTFFPWNGTCHIYTFTSVAPSNEDCYFRKCDSGQKHDRKISKAQTPSFDFWFY